MADYEFEERKTRADKDLFSQAGALPFRINRAGQIEVLLVRRVEKDKWNIPKGLIGPGKTLEETARHEAAEEAGVTGQLSTQPIGYYSFKKWGGICHVTVFLLRVEQVLPEYAEQDRRERRWFPLDVAADEARRKAVRQLIADLPRLIKEQHLDGERV